MQEQLSFVVADGVAANASSPEQMARITAQNTSLGGYTIDLMGAST